MEILIISIGALGDVLRTTFIAQALKDKYAQRQPEITWVTDKKALPFFSNNPYVDAVIIKENKHNVKNKPFDLVINLEDNKEICKFVSELNTKKIIGTFLDNNGNVDYTPESAYWFDMSLSSKKGSLAADKLKKKNAKTHREILSEMLGISSAKYEPFLRLTQRQKVFAQNFAKRHNVSGTEIVIGINSGSADTWPKALPIRKTAKIIDTLYKKVQSKNTFVRRSK